LSVLDEDMAQYIHDNTDDEFTHFSFVNAYLKAHGMAPANLEKLRTLPSSTATGAQQIGRLTNLMQLTVDTNWWTRYRSDSLNPDFGDTLPQAIPDLATGQHPGIPRSNNDLEHATPPAGHSNQSNREMPWPEQAAMASRKDERVSSGRLLGHLVCGARRSGCARALWLSRNALDHLSGVLVFPLQGDIGLRNHADEAIVLGGHGQTPHLVLRHNVERGREIVVGTHGEKLARGDLGRRHPARIFALGDGAYHDVAICDDPHKPIAFDERNRSHILGCHQLGDLVQGCLRRHGTRSLRHDICNFGAHLAPFRFFHWFPASPPSNPRSGDERAELERVQRG
jgi:hypothetical protein